MSYLLVHVSSIVERIELGRYRSAGRSLRTDTYRYWCDQGLLARGGEFAHEDGDIFVDRGFAR